MSARIAPEPVSIAISQAAQFAPRQTETTRPVESAGSTSADPGRDHAFGRRLSDGEKARPGDRPPGKDPSMLPQALFDAALIASEFKPETKPAENKDKPAAPAKTDTKDAAIAKQTSAPEQTQAEIAAEVADKTVPIEPDAPSRSDQRTPNIDERGTN